MPLSEEQAEILGLTDLATNLADGMAILKPANIVGPIRSYGKDLPQNLFEVENYVDSFIDWQIGRTKDPDTKAGWSQPEAREDTLKYVRRKVWQSKTERGAIVNAVARMLATTACLHRQYRGAVHEALNHAVKHNEDLKLLGSDLRDQLDEVVRLRLEETTKAIAGAALATVPQLQQVLMQGRAALTHD